jgi:NAD(P)H-nitrite reductase large subunit
MKHWNFAIHKDKKMHYVIIGNSVAAIGAIEAIRNRDKTGSVTVISDEPYSVYSRPLISYLLAGKVDENMMFYGKKNFYEENSVGTKLGQTAVELDIDKRIVELENKELVSYDKLLIATGGTPIIPQVEGKDLKGVFTFTKWDDAKNIKDFIERNSVKKAIVIGGGLIGLKAAEALIELAIKVTVVELADRILSVTFDKRASQMVEDNLRGEGVEIIFNNTVVQIEAEGSLNEGSSGKERRVNGVVLRDKRKLASDLVIFAIGVKPNVSLVKDTPVKVNRGILVNQYMQTCVDNVYAAGDVAEAFDLVMGIARPIPIWPNAYRQGSVAGCNMAGGLKEYQGGLAMNSIEIFGVSTISVGQTDPDEENYQVLQEYNRERKEYKKIVLKDDFIVGAIFIGSIERAGIITAFIKERTNVRNFKDYLMREDFGLIYLPSDYRKHMVSGMGIEV